MPNKTPFDGIQSEIYVPVTPPPVWAEVKKPLNQMKVAIATACSPLTHYIYLQRTA